MLSFQKLDVYRCSIEFVAVAVEIGGTIPCGHGELRDHQRHRQVTELLVRIVAMLTKLCR